MKFLSFDNCGQQLKTLSKVLRWLAVIAGLILAVVGLVQSFSGYSAEAAAGIAMLIGGLTLVITGWIGSLFLYGFGIIVAANEEKTEGVASKHASSPKEGSSAPSFSTVKPISRLSDQEPKTPKRKEGSCPICGNPLDASLKNCPHCSKAATSKLKATDKGWFCPKCDSVNPHHVGTCANCGEVKPY